MANQGVYAEVYMRGDVKIQSRLTQWARRAGNTIPAMEAVQTMLQLKEEELFASDGGSGRHGEWQELSQSTVEAKDAQGLHPEILRATDWLYASLVEHDDEFAIREIGPGFLRYGTKLPYAKFHMTGFRDRAGNDVPPRRPIDWTVRDKEEAVAIISEWITAAKLGGKRFLVPIKPSMRTLIL